VGVAVHLLHQFFIKDHKKKGFGFKVRVLSMCFTWMCDFRIDFVYFIQFLWGGCAAGLANGGKLCLTRPLGSWMCILMVI
jgi:hypothetical protein